MLVLIALVLAAPPETVAVSVQGSLEASLVRAVGRDGQALAAQVARLVGWRGDVVRNVHPGDELRVAWRAGEGPVLVAVIYRGAELTLTAYLYSGDDGIDRFYDDTGALVEPVLVRGPVASYVQITEVVQRGSGKRKHTGIDIKADLGTPVVLPFAGVVARANWSTRTNGNCVEVRYNSGAVARFLHLDEIDPAVSIGVRLAAGARIGAVGSTGRSLAPHLHYEIRSPSGDVMDPFAVHGRSEAKLTPARLGEFAALRANYAALMSVIPDKESRAR